MANGINSVHAVNFNSVQKYNYKIFCLVFMGEYNLFYLFFIFIVEYMFTDFDHSLPKCTYVKFYFYKTVTAYSGTRFHY